ncbi:MAG: hypothetical protein GX868_04230 [Actinobacteria bacterium]|nr:hypothetical protein [Actinomycetota bacterium]
MFESVAGSLLIARPEVDDPHFRRAVVYLVDHNDEGAFGVVINRPSEIDLDQHLDLPAGLTNPPAVFFEGGPVDDNAVVALGSENLTPPRLIDIDALLNGDLDAPSQLRFFAGYSGWSAGQLDAELAADSWFVVAVRRAADDHDDIFGSDPANLWRTVLRRQPPPLAALALYPENLMAN